jgi:hypothetical protein
MTRDQLREIFVLANEFKEGDLNVGGTRDDDIRREARDVLAALKLRQNREDLIEHEAALNEHA